MINVITTITTSSGLPITPIPGDIEEGEISGFIFPSVYGSSEFDLSLFFTVSDGINNYNIISVTPVVDYSEYGIVINTITSSTLTISGNVINVFPGEFYRFLLKDGSEENLPPNTTTDWVSIIAWGIPNIIETNFYYSFDIEYENDGIFTITTTATQIIFWNFENSLNTFRNLIG